MSDEVFWFDEEFRWWCAVGSRVLGPFGSWAECAEAYYRRMER